MNPTRSASDLQQEAPTILWRGAHPEYQTHVVNYLFWPFAVVEKLIHGLYDSLICTRWSTLFRHDRGTILITCALGFAFALVFAIAIYQSRAYADWIILGLGLVWLTDWWISKIGFKHPVRVCRSVMTRKGDDLRWRSAVPGGGTVSASFSLERIACVALDCIEVRLGVFNNRAGQVWRGLLVLDSGERYPLFDELDVSTAMQKAEQAAGKFNTAVCVSASLGESDLATNQSFIRAQFLPDRDKTISARAVGARVRIDKRLSAATLSRCTGRVLSEAGFPLFLLLVYCLLLPAGGLLSALLHPIVGVPLEPVMVESSMAGMVSFFAAEMDLLRFFEFAVALACIGFKAWRLSRPIMVHVDEKLLVVRVGKNEVGRLPTGRITDFVLVEEPLLTLLVIDEQRHVIELNTLDSAFEYKHVMARLMDAVFAAQRRKQLAVDKQAA